MNNNVDVARAYLDAGGNIDFANDDDDEEKTALMQAASRHANACVELLCTRGANVAAMDLSEFTALHWAAYFKSGASTIDTYTLHFR